MHKIVAFSLAMLASSVSMAQLTTVECTPIGVGHFDSGTPASRTHVKCAESIPDGGSMVRYFALPTPNKSIKSDKNFDSDIIGLATAAMIRGKTLTVIFNAGDTSATAYGCGFTNCRRPVTMFFEGD